MLSLTMLAPQRIPITKDTLFVEQKETKSLSQTFMRCLRTLLEESVRSGSMTS
jgi:hypothetical protein